MDLFLSSFFVCRDGRKVKFNFFIIGPFLGNVSFVLAFLSSHRFSEFTLIFGLRSDLFWFTQILTFKAECKFIFLCGYTPMLYLTVLGGPKTFGRTKKLGGCFRWKF